MRLFFIEQASACNNIIKIHLNTFFVQESTNCRSLLKNIPIISGKLLIEIYYILDDYD